MNRIPSRLMMLLAMAGLTLAIVWVANSARGAGAPIPQRDPQIGQSFQVPYRLTDTNHLLVRVRINGKGPFNFLVDSGAPALFIATETAKKIGLKPAPDQFWTPVDCLEMEGGSRLTTLKARVEDPFQLVGMNALGLPGASIDGILGFTILARFRLEIDLTKDRMTWTRLDHNLPDPPTPDRKPGNGNGPPAGVQAMSALGPLAKGLAFLMGKQPEQEFQSRGFLGLEWSEELASGGRRLYVRGVLAGSPAARGGVQTGDLILRINAHVITGLKDARAILAEVHPRNRVRLDVRRGSSGESRELQLMLTAGEGL